MVSTLTEESRVNRGGWGTPSRQTFMTNIQNLPVSLEGSGWLCQANSSLLVIQLK